MARYLWLVQTAGILLLLISLSSIFIAELHRLRLHRQQLGKELSALHASLSGFPLKAASADSSNHPLALPPLDTIIDEQGKVIGNPQVLLQFAVVGFGKCGTSSLMLWLEQHPELQMLNQEVWALTGRDPARLIRRLHKKLTANLPRGYKCPGDVLAQFVMDYYRKYWPQTKLFVGIRHPVLWYQSLYNFRVQNFNNFDSLPHPNQLIGTCTSEWALMCMGRGFFGYHLMKLGKQHWNGARQPTELELKILERMGFANKTEHIQAKPQPNDIFLFEIQQLSDYNRTRHDQFKSDIQRYLQLREPLPDMVHFRPGMEWHDTLQKKKDEKKIDICEDQFIPSRIVLMQMARMSSEWFREVFIKLPGVHVSSKEYLQHILATEWMADPCGDRSDRVSLSELDQIVFNTTGMRTIELNELARHRLARKS